MDEPEYHPYGLLWDKSRNQWLLRLTVDCGLKVMGKRLKMYLRAGTLEESMLERDATIRAYERIGLTVAARRISRVTPPEDARQPEI